MANANDNGLAIKPPLGWRSWNLYGQHVNQQLIMESWMVWYKGHALLMVSQTLCDLSYCDVGLDDNWQLCGAPNAAPGMNYHDKDGNPIVNLDGSSDFNNTMRTTLIALDLHPAGTETIAYAKINVDQKRNATCK